MKNDKILNFLIAFFLAFIVMSFFKPSKEPEKGGAITVSAAAKSYTIPNVPVITIKNTEKEKIVFYTCNDLMIYKDSKLVEGIGKSYPEFCDSIELKQGMSYVVNLDMLSKMFQHAGEFRFKLVYDSKEYETTVTQSEKGFTNTFFSTLFYGPVYNLFVLIIGILPNHSLGIAIILVTIIIRLIVLVPQQRIMVNSKKMQKIQPQIKEIQSKYKGDQSKIGMELLELYKKEKVNPMGSCLPLLIQLPLLIVLYWTISGITQSSNYYYLYGPLSDFNIKSINAHFLGLNLIMQEWKSGLALAILIGGFQWLQIKMSLTVQQKRRDHGKTVVQQKQVDDPVSEFMPDPEVMNRFMLWGMPMMLAFSSYFLPSGVGIYWLIGTLFTIVQQYFVNKKSERSGSPTTKQGHEILTQKG